MQKPNIHNKSLIDQSMDFVKKTLADAEGGHDWFHTLRVYKNALHIAQGEMVNTLVVALGALFHDIADSKFHDGDERVGPQMARDFLEGKKIDDVSVEHVVNIVKHGSFKGGNQIKTFDSLELQVVQDADRLDALGAIGIARTFNYGGFKNRKLYDPEIPPKLNMSPTEYKMSLSPTINHFYEKLLLLKDLMHTKTGRQLAEERHRYMEGFLRQFYNEVGQ